MLLRCQIEELGPFLLLAMGPPIPLIPQGNCQAMIGSRYLAQMAVAEQQESALDTYLHEDRWTVPVQPGAADLGPLPAPVWAPPDAFALALALHCLLLPAALSLGRVLFSQLSFWLPVMFLLLPSRFLFLSTGTLILVYSTGSSCL